MAVRGGADAGVKSEEWIAEKATHGMRKGTSDSGGSSVGGGGGDGGGSGAAVPYNRLDDGAFEVKFLI